MAKAQTDKRARLIETAMKLAYKHGFRETSLADIAEAAHVPLGNVYYYFKTKDELGEAVVEQRLAEFRAFRDELDRLSSPKERLFAFVESIHRNREQLRVEDVLWAACARSCTRRAALSQRNPRRSLLSQCVGLRSSSGPLAMKRIHENSRSICSPPFRVWRLLRSAPTTARWW